MRMVRVEWLDSCSPARMWQETGCAERVRPSKIVSVGFLVCKNKRHVTIMQSVNHCNEGNILCIPRACVTHIARVKR